MLLGFSPLCDQESIKDAMYASLLLYGNVCVGHACHRWVEDAMVRPHTMLGGVLEYLGEAPVWFAVYAATMPVVSGAFAIVR
jgi:hypothetical protein